jgi:hypothetical protein
MTTILPRDRPGPGTAAPRDPRVDVPVVGDDAGLAAGEADRVAAELADGDRHAIAMRRRPQYVARAGRDWPTPPARRSRSSVVSPIAETTTTTPFRARVRITRSATSFWRAASATLEPPYFWTTMDIRSRAG